MVDLTSIFDNVVKEASNKNLYHTLDKYSLNNSFTHNNPILIIRDKEKLICKLDKYIDITCDFYKLDKNTDNIIKIINNLFKNATYEDFSNPLNFIDNQINYYLNENIIKKDYKINNINIKNYKQQFNSTTPYIFMFGNDKIEYGISNNVCYIYTFTSLLSLALFFNELYNCGINNVKIVSNLPLRDNCLDVNNLDKLNNIYISSYPFEQDEYFNLIIDGIIDKVEDNIDSILETYKNMFERDNMFTSNIVK